MNKLCAEMRMVKKKKKDVQSCPMKFPKGPLK